MMPLNQLCDEAARKHIGCNCPRPAVKRCACTRLSYDMQDIALLVARFCVNATPSEIKAWAEESTK